MWTGENDTKSLRVDAEFFKTEKKSLRFQTNTDTCGLGLMLLIIFWLEEIVLWKSRRDHCPALRNVHYWFPPVTQKRRMFELPNIYSSTHTLNENSSFKSLIHIFTRPFLHQRHATFKKATSKNISSRISKSTANVSPSSWHHSQS